MAERSSVIASPRIGLLRLQHDFLQNLGRRFELAADFNARGAFLSDLAAAEVERMVNREIPEVSPPQIHFAKRIRLNHVRNARAVERGASTVSAIYSRPPNANPCRL